MKVYVPVVDCTVSKKAYTNKCSAWKALDEFYNKESKRRSYLKNFPYNEIAYLNEYELDDNRLLERYGVEGFREFFHLTVMIIFFVLGVFGTIQYFFG